MGEETDVQKKIAMLAAAGEFVPDMQRRTIMNIILLGGAAVPVGWMGGAFVYFFVPPSGGGSGAGLVAKDALGDDVTKDGWTAKHPAGDRALVQGLKGMRTTSLSRRTALVFGTTRSMRSVLTWAALFRGTGLRTSSCVRAMAASTTRRARLCAARLRFRSRWRTWTSTMPARWFFRPGQRPTSARTRR